MDSYTDGSTAGDIALNETNTTAKQIREALRNNDLALFEKLIRKANREDLKYLDSDGKTFFEVAVSEPNKHKFVKILLKYGADANKVNNANGAAPIHLAVENGNDEALQVLLEDSRTDVNVMRKGNTPLLTCIKKLQKETARDKIETYEKMIDLLLKAHCDVNTPDSRGMTPVAWAAKIKLRSVLEKIADYAKYVDLDTYKDWEEKTAHDYISELFPDLLPKFISSGEHKTTNMKNRLFNLLNSGQENEFTHLFKNVTEENDQKMLLLADDGRGTLLQLAAKNGLERIVEFLLRNAEADPNYTCPYNRNRPIVIACQQGYHKIVRMLMNHSSTSFEHTDGESLIQTTVKAMRSQSQTQDSNTNINFDLCLKLLVENSKIDINHSDSKGNTALHYAARNGDSKTVLTLLRNGACIGLTNDYDIPPLADINAKTLETFLDECITSKGERPSDDDYEIGISYRFLVYPNNPTDKEKEPLIDHSKTDDYIAPETEALMFMTKYEELRPLLKHPVITSFLYLKWQRISCLFYANITFYFLLWLCLILYIILGYGVEMEQTTSIETLNIITHVGAVTGLILLIFRELFQLLVSPMQYLRSVENWMEIALIFVTAWIVSYNSAAESTKQQLSAVAILLSSAELVLLIGQFPTLSTNIVMLKTVCWNFFKFLLWYCILIIAFALSFYTLFRHEERVNSNEVNQNTTKEEEEEEDFFDDPARSLFKTLVMLTGEFDASSIKFSTFPVTSHIIFIVFVFMIPIVLFNLLNGLAVSDTQEIRANAELVGHISRVKLISYFESVLIGTRSTTRPNSCWSWLPFDIGDLNIINPKTFCMKPFAKRITLFPHFLPKYKIIVMPNQGNRIEIPSMEQVGNFGDDYEDIESGESCLVGRCKKYRLERKIVKNAKYVITKKITVTEFDEIKNKINSLETMLLEVLQKLK